MGPHRQLNAPGRLAVLCGCEGLNGGTVALDGVLCGNREIGPTPPAAPANIACFTGQGQLSPLSMGKRTEAVAFRVDVEDRGEPGAGKNAGSSDDRYPHPHLEADG